MIAVLHFHGQVLPDFILIVDGLLSRKTPPGLGVLEHVILFQEGELVAGHEVGVIVADQEYGCVDRVGAEAQVR